MEKFSLPALGWDNFFELQLNCIDTTELLPGRIMSEHKTNYTLLSEEGTFRAEVTGKLLYTTSSDAGLPKVGDWVLFAMMDDDKAIIHHVLQRKIQLARKTAGRKMEEQIVVANLDVLFIVQGLDDNYNLSRAERYLAALPEGILPVLILNKSDCCNNVAQRVAEAERRIPGIRVVVTSGVNDDIGMLTTILQPGKTFAFIGSSGAGKSTLINKLVGSQIQSTTSVREKDSRGRHTTTRREMFCLPSGGVLVDTPGMREFQPWAEGGDTIAGFNDIEQLASSCRYKDCRHLHEHGCAVKDAVERGVVDRIHYENYHKLKREIEYQESLTDGALARERKRANKELQRSVNAMIRRKKGQ